MRSNTRLSGAAWVLSCGLTLAACSAPGHLETTPVDVLTLTDQLVAARPLTKAKVEGLTGVRLKPNNAGYNPLYALYVSASPRGMFKQVELREARPGATQRGGIAILDLDPKTVALDHAEIPKRYGKDFAFEPPGAHGPPNAPAYYLYTYPWGELRFGFSRSNGRLEVVVIDAKE